MYPLPLLKFGVVAALIICCMSVSTATAASKKDAFATWVSREAKREGFVVKRVLSGNLDLDREPERAAQLCDEVESGGGLIVLEDEPGRRWVIPGEWISSCDSADIRIANGRLEVADYYASSDVGRGLALRDGRPVILSSSVGRSYELGGAPPYSEKVDWEALRFNYTASWDPHTVDPEASTEPQPYDVSGTVFIVTSSEVASRPANEVTFGATRWTGALDASLLASVRPEQNAVTVRLEAVDDVSLLPADQATAKGIVARDHFELWWMRTKNARATEECIFEPQSGDDTFHLAVAKSASGTWFARWLEAPEKSPPLRVRAAATGVEVTVPLRLLSMRQEPTWCVPFTAVFSDADDPERGQQTLIATSTLRHNRPRTFGRLVMFPKGERYLQVGHKPRKSLRQAP